jgi:hypothetical protein
MRALAKPLEVGSVGTWQLRKEVLDALRYWYAALEPQNTREGGEMARRDVSGTSPARPLHMVITASPRQAMAQKAPQLEVSQAAAGYRVH